MCYQSRAISQVSYRSSVYYYYTSCGFFGWDRCRRYVLVNLFNFKGSTLYFISFTVLPTGVSPTLVTGKAACLVAAMDTDYVVQVAAVVSMNSNLQLYIKQAHNIIATHSKLLHAIRLILKCMRNH